MYCECSLATAVTARYCASEICTRDPPLPKKKKEKRKKRRKIYTNEMKKNPKSISSSKSVLYANILCSTILSFSSFVCSYYSCYSYVVSIATSKKSQLSAEYRQNISFKTKKISVESIVHTTHKILYFSSYMCIGHIMEQPRFVLSIFQIR